MGVSKDNSTAMLAPLRVPPHTPSLWADISCAQVSRSALGRSHPFIQQVSVKHLYAPVIVLGAGDSTASKISKIPLPSWSSYTNEGRLTINKGNGII